MQYCVCRAARSRYTGDGVFDGGLVYDLRWQNISAKKVNDKFPGSITGFGLCVVRSRSARKAHRRHSKKSANQRHGIGGKLAAAGAGSRAGHAFQRGQTLLTHFLAAISAHSLEDILNSNGMAFKLARRA